MKTIEQAAKEYADSLKLDDAHRISKQQFEEYAQDDFKAGVEFATKWHSFKDNRPPYYTTCLVKVHEKTEPISAWLANTGDSDVWTICSTDIVLPHIEFWRPITFL